MWEEIIKLALGNGLWAVLFCVLLLYGLRDGRIREQKYRQTIDVLLLRLGQLQNVSDAVEELTALLRAPKARRRAVPTVTEAEAAHV